MMTLPGQTANRVPSLFWTVGPLEAGLKSFVVLALRQLCVERERACDDLVLDGGCPASDYARQLVEIAKSYRRLRHIAAIAMARATGLEGRIRAIVDSSRSRRLHSATALADGTYLAYLRSTCGDQPALARAPGAGAAGRQRAFSVGR
jgi:hypothetical protein